MSEVAPARAHRRSAKACNLCRSRKVRCDVVTCGPPCTNCRLDRVECNIPADGPRHRKRAQTKPGRSSTSTAAARASESRPEFDILGNINDLNSPQMRPSPEDEIAVAAGSSVQNAFRHPHLHNPDRPQVNLPPPSEAGSRTFSDTQISTSHLNSSPSKHMSNAQSGNFPKSAAPDIYLPAFIRPLPSHLQVEDLEFLHRKGAFAVQEASLRERLLTCYLHSVHPFMPILDLEQLAAIVDQQKRYPPMSLLLFQAVMLAATPYIDMRYLVMHGYTNRRAVRRTFFTRVKLLSDLDYETDRLAIIQATMLMTYWHEDPESAKNAYFWQGDAVSHLRDVGFDRIDPGDHALKPQERSRRKRLWWSCYVRDRLCSTSIRSNTRISDGSFRVPKLKLADFETESMPECLSRLSAAIPTALSSSTRQQLAQLFMVLVELCVHVGQILNAQNGLGRSQDDSLDRASSVQSDAGKNLMHPTEVIRYDCVLQQWHTDYAALLGFCGTISTALPPEDECQPLDIHRAMVKGLFLTTLNILHRQQLLSTSPVLVENQELVEYSRRKAFGAANDITTLFSHLETVELLRSMPNTAVTCLVTAAVSHLLEQKTDNSKRGDEVAVKLRFCVNALNILAECYGSAEFASRFIDAAILKTQNILPQTDNTVNGVAAPPVVESAGAVPTEGQTRTRNGHEVASPSAPRSMSNQAPLTANGQPAFDYTGSDLSSMPGSDAQLPQYNPNMFLPVNQSGNYSVGLSGGGMFYPVTTNQPLPQNLDFFDMTNRTEFFTFADGLGLDFDSGIVDMLVSNA